METFTKVSGKTIKLTGKEFTNTPMELNMRVIGSKINNMVTEKKFGLMEPATKVITKKEKSMELVTLSGQINQLILESFTITTSLEKVFILGLMEESMMVTGLIIKCMVEVSFHGVMVAVMKANTKTIRKKVRVFSHGQMVVNTMESGKTANRMD
jgi:hypothetical protein